MSNLQSPTSSFLIVQTAFIGDVILATSILEKLYYSYTGAKIDFLVRKGNESLFTAHPFIQEVIIWDKKSHKLKNLLKISKEIRNNKYDYVINLNRFGSSGFITAVSGAKHRWGFDKNPFSFAYTKKVKHELGSQKQTIFKHEVQRNHELIKDITDDKWLKPKLYPTDKDFESVSQYKSTPFICMAPTSVWYTKQLPKEKWTELINKTGSSMNIYLLGASSDYEYCDGIIKIAKNKFVVNLAGKLSLLQSAALMKDAQMNYVNDSAPLHIASAMNAPVTAFFCSTVPAFGFGPLSDYSVIIETEEILDCKPCGLHGYKSCPLGHFKCGHTIKV